MKIAGPRLRAPYLTDLVDAPPDLPLVREGTDGHRITDAVLDGPTRKGTTFTETEFIHATINGAEFTNCRFLDVRFDGLAATDLLASRSSWRNSEIVGSRVGAMSLDDAKVNGLRLDRCKIGFLGLQRADVDDLLVEHCDIEELDLTDATIARVAFRDTTIDQLRVRAARLRHVDLRGARLGGVDHAGDLRGAAITFDQLVDLAPDLASVLGILVD